MPRTLIRPRPGNPAVFESLTLGDDGSLGGAEELDAPAVLERQKQGAQLVQSEDWEREVGGAMSPRPAPQAEPTVSVTMGTPEIVSRKPMPKRPQVDVAKAGSAGAPRPFESLEGLAPAQGDGGIPPEVRAYAQRGASDAGPPTAGGDEEFRAAQAEARNRALGLAFGRAGGMANEAISGARTPNAQYDAMGKDTDLPVRELVAQRQADQKARLTDPASEESQRLRMAVSKAMPGVYSPEELEGITAADEPFITRYGEMRQRLDQRQADMQRQDAMRAEDIQRQDANRQGDRSFQASQAERQRQFQREMAASNNAAGLERARLSAAGGGPGGVGARGTVIPGLEVQPGAAPTPDDAKKVKAAVSARERLNTMADELGALHEKYGTEFGGEAAARMGQLSTALQLEAKTLAELGALTGPDMDLMLKLTGADPSSLGANLKALVGMDSTQASIRGVKKWGEGLANATANAYGYQPPPGQPARVPAVSGAPIDQQPTAAPPGDNEVKMRSPDGQEFFVDISEAADAEANGWTRAQ